MSAVVSTVIKTQDKEKNTCTFCQHSHWYCGAFLRKDTVKNPLCSSSEEPCKIYKQSRQILYTNEKHSTYY